MSLLLVAALACGIGATAHYRELQAESRRLEALLLETGLAHRHPAVATSVRREPDPGWGAVLLARALLAEELDRSWIAGLSQKEREMELGRSPARLAMAYEEAARLLVARPANWQAAMTVGGAAYLAERRGLRGAASQPWEPGLTLAYELGPHRLEPARMLAAAQIGRWSSLGEVGQEKALSVILAAFRDSHSFELLLGPWLRVAPGLESAFSVLPDVPETWHELQRHFDRLQDWERFAAARRRWYPAQHRRLEGSAAEGERRLRTGDTAGGRNVLLKAAAAAPVEAGFAQLFTRAVRAAPAGWQGRRDFHRFREWLDWCLALDRWGGCPLPGDVLAKLVRELQSGQETAALAHLASGDLAAARALAGWSGGKADDPTWVTIRIREALLLEDRGATEEARALLASLPTAARGELFYRWALSRIAAATAIDFGNGLRRSNWPASVWEGRERRAAARLLPERSASGIAIELAAVAPEGAVIEAHWNGRRQAIRAVAMHDVFRVDVDVEPGKPQRLEIHTVAGRPVTPGAITLLD